MVAALIVIGQLLTLVGAGLGAYAVYVNEDQAIKLGLSKWAGDTRDEHLKDPSVINLLEQSRWGLYVFVLIAVGTGLQIIGTLMQAAGSS